MNHKTEALNRFKITELYSYSRAFILRLRCSVDIIKIYAYSIYIYKVKVETMYTVHM